MDLSIWPWQLVLVPGPRATPIGGGTRAAFDPDRLALELRFLLVCKDADDAVAKLTLAHAVIVQAPVVQVDGVNVQVVSETLAPADLSALFAAAGIKLSLSSAYVLRSTV
ncbi:MAG: hypothetical protein QN178_04945 [Armatimonadota bacterium]|nr:hypothetical protein [Armatimonadota bacterium]